MSQQLAQAALVHAEGAPRAVLAVARKLAMILHAMWRDGSEFRFGQAHRQMRKLAAIRDGSDRLMAHQAQYSPKKWSDFFAGALVSQLTPDRQRAFITSLRNQSYSDGYIRRVLQIGQAALNRALREGEIAIAPKVLVDEARERILSMREAATLLSAARTPRLAMFLLLAFGTAAECHPRANDVPSGLRRQADQVQHARTPAGSQAAADRPDLRYPPALLEGAAGRSRGRLFREAHQEHPEDL